MKQKLIRLLVQALLTVLSDEMLKGFVDAGLDYLEDKIKESKNKIDDIVVLPICKQIRDIFDIPDNNDD